MCVVVLSECECVGWNVKQDRERRVTWGRVDKMTSTNRNIIINDMKKNNVNEEYNNTDM